MRDSVDFSELLESQEDREEDRRRKSVIFIVDCYKLLRKAAKNITGILKCAIANINCRFLEGSLFCM